MNKKKLYTLLIEYEGGSYLSQGKAFSPKEGVLACVQNQNISAINGLKESHREDFISEIQEDTATPVKSLKNVWCFCVTIKKETALLTLVQTDPK